MEFIDRLILLMEEKSCNQTTLSKLTKIPRTTISGWFNQNKLPDFSATIKLCNFFGIPADELLGIVEYGSTPKKQNITPELSSDEQRILEIYRKIPQNDRKLAIHALNALIDAPDISDQDVYIQFREKKNPGSK